jgi:hypothetical protein
MKSRQLVWTMAVAGLMASEAGAVEFFMPVPDLGASYKFRTEFVRDDVTLDRVDFTFIASGQSGVGLPSQTYTVLPGPSTDRNHPLLTDNPARDFGGERSDAKYFLPGGGLVILEGEPGLLAAEAAVEIGSDPTSAWELPLLTHDDAFTAGDTAYVLDLMKKGTTASELSIFNLDGTAAQCGTVLRSTTGRALERRAGIAVPALGSVRLADVLRRVTVGAAAGLSVAVTCDHAFYALGSFPSDSLAAVRVHYPSAAPPVAGTLQTLLTGASLRVTQNHSVATFDLPLEEGVQYHSIAIDCDVAVAAPANDAFFRSLVGMWRDEPDQRFGKRLYFGVNERYDRSKLLADLGTPYIEELTKKGGVAFLAGHNYHFHVEVSSDERSLRLLVTTRNGAVISDVQTGIFNEDLSVRNGHTVTVGFGLPGIGDQAYSPPYGWRFSNIVISGYK